MLEWICRRLDGEDTGTTTPIGVVPTADDLNLDGLDEPRERVDAALAVDLDEWRAELPGIHAYFDELGERLPGDAARRARGTRRPPFLASSSPPLPARPRARHTTRSRTRPRALPRQSPATAISRTVKAIRRDRGWQTCP